jgi:hypothetical protein
LHGVLRQTCGLEAFADQLRQRRVAFERLRTAAQNRRVARLQAQRGGVDRHVRTRFIDDADHAERHAHLTDLNAAWPVLQIADLTNRIGQRGDLPQAFNHRLQRLVRQRQAIDKRSVETFVASASDITRVGIFQQRGIALDRLGNGRERSILRRSRRTCHRARSVAGATTEVGHVLVDIHGDSHDAAHIEVQRTGRISKKR